jgi:antitoxin HigA-1
MPRPAIHPGEILRDELAELGVTPTELSRQIEVPPNRVTEIIHGRRSITGDTALRLGQWFGSSARFWLNLQSAYELRAAEQRAGKDIERIKRRPADPDAPAAKRLQAEARLLDALFGRKRPDAATTAEEQILDRLRDPPREPSAKQRQATSKALAAALKRPAKKAAAKHPAPAKKHA